LDYDVSMDEVVELVVMIPTSPRSSKTESGCKSYRCFHVDDSSGFSLEGADFWPDNPGVDIPLLLDPDNPPPPPNLMRNEVVCSQ
jgi:hypothetical protein